MFFDMFEESGFVDVEFEVVGKRVPNVGQSVKQGRGSNVSSAIEDSNEEFVISRKKEGNLISEKRWQLTMKVIVEKGQSLELVVVI